MNRALFLSLFGLFVITLTCQADRANCEKGVSVISKGIREHLDNDARREYDCQNVLNVLEGQCRQKKCGPCEYGMINCVKSQKHSKMLVITNENCCSHC
ncbi:unnamed protein product [Bursaphelenchus xylophilus]|uniref:(pine wood nematode) hypothetical protein n=1 Tax=Bursaphelenchus xylophilus TaxID=6326 RepID=A0A1I7RYU4_BURXY|nr:unnamed protein product [Bursaphelenchus xylophilus]CAG9092217.1 unnamed protein product [Bursaphelenchus xylophilus]